MPASLRTASAPSPPVDGPVVPGPGHSLLRPLAFDAVALRPGGFLGDWQVLNRAATIPHVVERLESSGVMDNFRRLVGRSDAPYRGFNFADSDLHKTLEAIAWEAGRRPDDQPWEQFCADAVELLAAAQREDGYLDSHVQGAGTLPFDDLRWGHELYVLGHLIQAAVARTRTTGSTDLLDVACRFADHVVTRFGAGGADGCCGHPEVETALVELARLTGEASYLELAQRQIDLRGSGLLGQGPFPPAYHQDHEAVRAAIEATGHAVRLVYLAAGMADVAAETGERALTDALARLWDSAEQTKTYVTGGLGSRHKDESLGDAFELPPDRAYAETCAAIGSVHWAWRMLLRTGESRYADAMERALYNAVAASTSLDGRAFFYSNPLQMRTGHDGASEYSPSARLPWFECACCPPNLARLVSSLHAYVATSTDHGVQVHLYGDADVSLPGGGTIAIRTAYPWDGRVVLDAGERGLTVNLSLRIPAWSDGARLTVDGSPHPVVTRDGYVTVAASPEVPLHLVELVLPMPVVAVRAHPRVDAVRGCAALLRGPVVFCLEQADLPADVVLEDVALVAGSALRTGPGDPAAGIELTVEADGVHVAAETAPWVTTGTPTMVQVPAAARRLTLRAVPYHRWANRGEGAMRVWIPVAAPQ